MTVAKIGRKMKKRLSIQGFSRPATSRFVSGVDAGGLSRAALRLTTEGSG